MKENLKSKENSIVRGKDFSIADSPKEYVPTYEVIYLTSHGPVYPTLQRSQGQALRVLTFVRSLDSASASGKGLAM